MKITLPVDIESQPSDSSCGPTCLQAIYGYWGHQVSVAEIIAQIPQLETGGTLAVQLACHALQQGFEATIVTFNLRLFDPTWFGQPGVDLSEKLRSQLDQNGARSQRFRLATSHYLQFLSLGGCIQMRRLDRPMVHECLRSDVPILTGLSATFLYQESRERSQPPDSLGVTCLPDDLGGSPVGHFVVLSGYDAEADRLQVSDPLHPNPNSKWQDRQYWATFDHVSASIYLGIVTYDANLLVIKPAAK
ncbi:hypothetical protein K227x_46290 [Rubripirellula lacrimiformis]|uniref:Peptidase C39 domain-containing protein n=1 Tax=Rubripirellula lacrimiformis TaxID=1930273 RepID=A0A517NGG8_9BACT|nr:cysteine peptidase family C39 domain-containing protein [Rubripirellula lacrimiformis]QDT06220.1 hypothetical protein K227x_46290 [Rubripirellula lacrimiformis]